MCAVAVVAQREHGNIQFKMVMKFLLILNGVMKIVITLNQMMHYQQNFNSL
jgi:hypothetical protein